MSNSKKILITTCSTEVFFVKRSNCPVLSYCPVCRAERQMLAIDEAVTFLRKNTRDMIAYAESGALHSIQTISGHLVFCRESLDEFLTRR